MTFAAGSLVHARGREWIVLPDSDADLLVVRPLGGSDDEVTGIYLPLEAVRAATFAPPDPVKDLGDFRSGRLLHEALRLSVRASAGPFRSFGRIAVEPRPYQLVPLLIALRQDPVRLLISDDVGIGKTVEALLIARELLDRGEIQRMAVLCPPHLAEQWQTEMRTKFHIDAELVVAASAARLEGSMKLSAGESVFDRLEATVVSMDFIKTETRRDEFIQKAPELVIVDEAHTCTDASAGRGSRHHRNRLVRDLAAKGTRHMIFVTATPHSGKDDAFGELLAFLDPAFRPFAQGTNDTQRARLAKHFVQRRRGDIKAYLDTETPFPEREPAIDATYNLSPAYRALLERVLAYARDSIRVPGEAAQRQRIRWWAALALLRSVSSSPRAAMETLRNRASFADTLNAGEIEELGRRNVLDMIEDESDEGSDVVPGAEADTADGEGASPTSTKRRLRDLATEAEALIGSDPKLIRGLALVRDLMKKGRNPIVFCRYIATAEYVAEALRDDLGRAANKREFGEVTVEAVTGQLPADERKARVEALADQPRRVLVATDCLSEGINLQRGFDAVIHYDLAWNPTRHEQREGRVDRYGQPEKTVVVATLYGSDNPIDGLVLDVLLRRHDRIRTALGFSVPVPVDSNAVLEAILEGILLKRPRGDGAEEQLVFFEDLVKPKKDDLHKEWERAAEAEKQSRSRFAQRAINVDEVAEELRGARAAVGSAVDVKRFTIETLERHGAAVRVNGVIDVDLEHAHRAFLEATNLSATLHDKRRFKARFEEPVDEKTLLLARTHPVVEGLASWVIDTALDPILDSAARRCGAVRTAAVAARTTALVVRIRYDLTSAAGGGQQIAEEARIVAFRGSPAAPEWLDEDSALGLFAASPSANAIPEQQTQAVLQVLASLSSLTPALETMAKERAVQLRDAHERVRTAGKLVGKTRVEARLPIDLLGIYVYLPHVTV
ncbi:MAG: DEAD/DEAH box helicase [Chloroflexi bacterium]|nr:DEAD/DEAH box helicase [Chloroflexota bacterium]